MDQLAESMDLIAVILITIFIKYETRNINTKINVIEVKVDENKVDIKKLKDYYHNVHRLEVKFDNFESLYKFNKMK